MEILAERVDSPVRNSILEGALKAYYDHKPVDASRLNDAEFEQFVHRIQSPVSLGSIVQWVIEKFVSLKEG